MRRSVHKSYALCHYVIFGSRHSRHNNSQQNVGLRWPLANGLAHNYYYYLLATKLAMHSMHTNERHNDSKRKWNKEEICGHVNGSSSFLYRRTDARNTVFAINIVFIFIEIERMIYFPFLNGFICFFSFFLCAGRRRRHDKQKSLARHWECVRPSFGPNAS